MLVFAMAPIGIITAIVSAIRVAGPLWLKTIIGRAHESFSEVEKDVMSSTSDDVGESFGGGGIVRTPGKPSVREVIWHRNDRSLAKCAGDCRGLHNLSCFGRTTGSGRVPIHTPKGTFVHNNACFSL